eukprot:4373175-Pleurochrysis_carterae.AAC.2
MSAVKDLMNAGFAGRGVRADATFRPEDTEKLVQVLQTKKRLTSFSFRSAYGIRRRACFF